ncbi:nucleotidyltransferase [Tardiphaga alba]|uniref:Nucleotidyltransferase n=1 Tax=Tardiphaga alba TaxID=340268 RepID=A0ABX8AGI4_9BRAD|nr:nucleotidyltransferase domain-containing protein [Tardiphaga alba]QUS42041.1 nucleotidyltransferase [Tardiphaga alba]
MKPSIALRKHHQATLAMAARHALRDVRVSRSVARGHDLEDNDLDLLVEPTPDVTTLFHIVDFQQAVEELLGVSVDVRTVEDINERFRPLVASEVTALPFG